MSALLCGATVDEQSTMPDFIQLSKGKIPEFNMNDN